MEVKPGYKQTEVGVIPEEWEVPYLRRHLLQDATYGVVKAGAFQRSGIPMLRSGEIKNASIIEDHPLITPEKSLEYSRTILKKNDVVIALVGYPGETAVIPDRLIGANISRAVGLLRPASNLTPEFLTCYLNSPNGRKEFLRPSAGSAQIVVNLGALNKLRLPVPSLPEQRAIATALSDVDGLLGGLDRLIAKKRDLKQAAMQQLLTGQTRLPGFHGEWEVKRITDIATPCSERNVSGEKLPVLTCSKHFGFMDSLGFFKNQVFSKDLSTYKTIRCGEIGYPANHVEEGSIGLQNLYDIALVSPIYVVFRVEEGINSYFLHRLLKLDSYRQRFKTATTSSVDRRGSLRWPAFSEITVVLPPTLAEQTAIAEVLTDMDAELAVLEQRREKTRALKQAMMQELLTGRTRLV